jgi:hypothetical protein
MNPETTMPKLYDRLGGVYSIAVVVDDFIDRVMRNLVLNANAAVDETHRRVSAAGFKYHVTEMVCSTTLHVCLRFNSCLTPGRQPRRLPILALLNPLENFVRLSSQLLGFGNDLGGIRVGAFDAVNQFS